VVLKIEFMVFWLAVLCYWKVCGLAALCRC